MSAERAPVGARTTWSGLRLRRGAPTRRFAHAQPRVLAAIALGGALGAVARYMISVDSHVPDGGIPWATLWINTSGSFVLGLVATWVLERWPPTRYVRPFVGIGFCGGFTTFSTAMVEAVLLARDGFAGTAVAYVVLQMLCGLAAVIFGIAAGRMWPAHERRQG